MDGGESALEWPRPVPPNRGTNNHYPKEHTVEVVPDPQPVANLKAMIDLWKPFTWGELRAFVAAGAHMNAADPVVMMETDNDEPDSIVVFLQPES